MFKLWDDTIPQTTLNSYYIANMKNEWQGLSASYMGSTRLDSDWRGWIRTLRAGEIQTIAINTPRIAAKSKGNVDTFISELETTVSKIVKGYNIMNELSRGFLLINKTVLPSVQRSKWTYVPIEHCLYSISLACFADAIKILTKKDLSENILIAEKILTSCNEFLQRYANIPLRVALKEELSPSITKRFSLLDKTIRGVAAPYSIGIGRHRNAVQLHKHLAGGHRITITKDKVANVLASDFGLALVTSNQTRD